MKTTETEQYLELFSELSGVAVADGCEYSFMSNLGVLCIEFDFKCDALLVQLESMKPIFKAFGFSDDGSKDIFSLDGIQSFIIHSIPGLHIRKMS